MKKLLVGLGAAGLALGAVADIQYITEGCDLATFGYSSEYTKWGVLAQTGGHLDYYLSQDLDKPFEVLYTITYGNTESSATIDLRNHTWYQTFEGFFFRASCNGTDPYNQPGASLTLKNGTFDGSRGTYTLQMGGFWDNSGVKGHYLLDNINITNYSGFCYGSEMAESDITFRNCNISVGSIRPFDHERNGETGLTITYENTTLTVNSDVNSDFTDNTPDIAANLDHKQVFTGSKTVVSTEHGITLGGGLPYSQTEILNGATIINKTGFYTGFHSTGYSGKLLVDHATIKGNVIFGGYAAGRQMMTFNESDLQVGSIGSGLYSDNNTMIISNCTMTSLDRICVGGWNDSDKTCARNNKLYICGQKTTIRPDWFNLCFHGANGLIALDDVSITANTSLQYFPQNQDGEAEDKGTVWENNEFCFQNDSDVKIADIWMGFPGDANHQCRKQKLTVKDGATLHVTALVVAGSENTITVSNATIESYGGNLLWCGLNQTGGAAAMENNRIVFLGDHPKIVGLVENSWSHIDSKTTFEFNLPEDATYKDVPFQGYNLDGFETYTSLEDNCINFSFPNLAQIQQTLVGTKEVELMRCTNALKFVYGSAEGEQQMLSDINATLPTGCYIYRTGNHNEAGSLFLHIAGGATAKPGAVLIIK